MYVLGIHFFKVPRDNLFNDWRKACHKIETKYRYFILRINLRILVLLKNINDKQFGIQKPT